MTRKKSFTDRAIAFVAALIFSLTLVLLFPTGSFIVSAEEPLDAVSVGMNISASITLNDQPLTENTQVRNGDTIALEVDWTLPTNFQNINKTFVYDLTDKLKGITLANAVIPVGNTAIYTVKDNKLYIQLLTGHSNRYGSCSLSGSINVSSEQVDRDSKFELQFIGTPEIGDGSHITSVPVIVTDYVAGLFVDKSAVGSLAYDNVSKKYTQEFEIKVRSNNNQSANVVLTDVGDGIYDFANISNVTINGTPLDANDTRFTQNNDGFTFNIGDLDAGESNEVVIKYTVPVNVDSYIEGATNNNKATGTAEGKDPVTDTAQAAISVPRIDKSGVYTAPATPGGEGSIEWTISVDPGVFGESANFTVTDIPDGVNLTEDQIIAALESTTLSKNDFVYNAESGKYVKTFTTTVPANQTDPVNDLSIKNKSVAKFDGITKEFSSEYPVTIPSKIKDYVTKTVGEQANDGTVPWTITIDVPDREVSLISIHDYTDKYGAMTMTPDMFTIKGADDTVGTLAVDQNAVRTATDIGYIDYISFQVQFYIDDINFLAANRGKTITITYNMTLPENIHTVMNTADVSFTIDGQTTYDSDHDTFSNASYTPSKGVLDNNSAFFFFQTVGDQHKNYKHGTIWYVKLASENNVPSLNEKFTIVDTIPEGMEYVPGTCLVSTSSNGSGGMTDIITATAGANNTITFEVTVNQALIDSIHPSEWTYNPIYIYYLTKPTDEGLFDLYQSPDTKSYTNSATVDLNGVDLGTVSYTHEITPPVENVVTKENYDGTDSTEVDPNNPVIYADYRVVINSAGLDLSDTDVVTATDTLGTNLKLEGSPVISPADGASCSYDPTTNVLTFSLKDNTTYTITYKVIVTTIGKNENVSDSDLNTKFGNQIVVDVSGGTDFSKNVLTAENYYRSEGDYNHDQKKTQITITGTKTWLSDSKDPGARPDKIIIKLEKTTIPQNGAPTVDYEYITVPVNELDGDENAWSYTIENLITLEENSGTEYSYNVTEVTAEGYTVTYPDNNNSGITSESTSPYELNITNTFTAVDNETGALNITKVWDDDNNANNTRPSDLTFTLTDESGNYVYNADVNNDVASFTGISLYSYSRDNNNTLVRTPRKYKLTESSTDAAKLVDYDLSISGVTLDNDGYFTLTSNVAANYSFTTPIEVTATNTYDNSAETTEATVKKVWNDSNNQDGKRPASLVVTLSNGATVTLNEAYGWTDTVTGLPKYAGGQEITYTWTEGTMPQGYTLTDTSVNGTVTTLTNTYTTETTEATVKKVWNDSNNQDGKRPASLVVTLSNGATVTLNEANGWTDTVTGLPKYENGQEITYTWTEDAVEGYQLTNTEKNGTTTTLTNTHTPETVSISGAKTWVDDNNRDGKRPASITVNLNKNGNTINSKVVTANDSWTYLFDSLPKYENGTLINYTITEDAVTDYTTAITDYNITNTYEPEKITITGTKSWEDNGYTNVVYPDVTVKLYADGNYVASATATAQSNWTYQFTDLYKYNAGREIVYTVTEVLIPDFTPSYNGYNITNTYNPDVTSVQVVKNWNDDNNRDGKRPASITVNLYADNVFTGETATLSAANGWSHTFINLTKSNGISDVIYTVTEDDVPNYDMVGITGDAATGYTITNSYTPETTTVRGAKNWNDDNNRDGKRPASITVNLHKNGDKIDSRVVTASDGWVYSFDNLPKYENGTLINYTVTEETVADYTTSIDGFDITNSYTPETTAVSGMKTWNDNNDAAGKRPASITVRLLANGREVASDTVNENDGWAYSFDNLPKYDGGNLIAYEITEDAVADYTTTINGFNITNTYTSVPDTTEATIKKVWNDDNNADGKRPASIVVTLSNGTAVTLSANNNWTVTVPDLPKYDASGAEIRYTWSEPSMPEGYRLTSTVVNGTVTTLTNTYTKQTDTNNPLQPTPPNVPNEPDVPDRPVVPVTPNRPIVPIVPNDPEDPEDVSSEAGVGNTADTLGTIDTASCSFIAILLVAATGGIVIARRRQKK